MVAAVSAAEAIRAAVDLVRQSTRRQLGKKAPVPQITATPPLDRHTLP